MSVAGYCPGTAIAAIGEGSKDMIVGLVGMLFGAFIFNELSPVLAPYLDAKDFAFQQTLGSVLGVSNFTIIMALILVWTIFALGVRKLEQRGQ